MAHDAPSMFDRILRGARAKRRPLSPPTTVGVRPRDPKVFAVCVAPTADSDAASPAWLRPVVDLLAETVARHTYDRVLLLHALPAGETRSVPRPMIPERIPGARYEPRDSVEVLDVHRAVPVHGLAGVLAELRQAHPDLDVILIETTACSPDQDPVLHAQGAEEPALKIVYLIDRPSFAYRAELVAQGFELVVAALLPEPSAPPGIGLTGRRVWDEMWSSAGAFARGMAELAGVTAANARAAVQQVARTVTDPRAWPVGAVRLSLSAAMEGLARAAALDRPARFADLSLAPHDELQVRESFRRWARQITHRRVGISLGGVVHLPSLARLASTDPAAAPPIDFVAGFQVPYLAELVARAVRTMLTRNAGLSQGHLADVCSSAPYDELGFGEALRSSQAMQQLCDEWRALLHRAPARVWVDQDDRRTIHLDGTLLFAEGRAEIAPSSLPLLHELGDFLGSHPALGVVVVGVGGPPELSSERERSILAALVRHGVERCRLEPRSAQRGAAMSLPPDESAEAPGVAIEAVDADRVLRADMARRGQQVAIFTLEVDLESATRPPIEVLAFCPESGRLALGARDGALRVLATEQGSLRELFGIDHSGSGDQAVSAVAWSPDGRLLASTGLNCELQLNEVSAEGAATLWKADARALGWEWDHLRLGFSADGRRLVGGAKRRPAVWTIDLEAGALAVVHLEVASKALAAALRPDGAVVATGEVEGTVILWDAATGEAIGAPVARGAAPIEDLVWSPDGSRLAVVSGAEVNVHVIGVGAVRLGGHTGRVATVAWRADGERLLTASRDNAARLWSKEGSLLAILVDDVRAPVTGVAWHPSRPDVAATWNEAGVALVWQVERARPLAVFTGHEARIAAAAWAPSGELFATAGADGTARLWDPELRARPG